ncbi:MAG: OmpA family protein [Sulfurovaceae bacterium]|nr:OmpA family protein [Sulfurovaceae bacterium]
MRLFFCFIDIIATVIVLGFFYHLIDEKSSSMVVLAENGKVQNAVAIQVGEHDVQLNEVGAMVSLQEGEKPSKVTMMSKEEMDRKFGNVLKAEPLKAKKIILYLNENNTALNDKSKVDMALVIETIKDRTPCMVDIIGHTDTTGDSNINIKLSLDRANLVKELIKKEGIDVSSFSVKGHGEEELLIPTSDNMKEPKNRNVEVFIK